MIFKDVYGRDIRLTEERQDHFVLDHPEMSGQFDKLQETLRDPDRIVRSKTDLDVELFYRHYGSTPVTQKHLCIVVKSVIDDTFIITAYFTDSIKKGELLWQRK